MSFGIRVIWLTSVFRLAASIASQHCVYDIRVAHDFEVIAIAAHVVGARLERKIHQRFFFDLIGRNRDQSLAIEHPGDAAGRAQLAAGDLKNLADFAGRAIAVVGKNIAQNRPRRSGRNLRTGFPRS